MCTEGIQLILSQNLIQLVTNTALVISIQKETKKQYIIQIKLC